MTAISGLFATLDESAPGTAGTVRGLADTDEGGADMTNPTPDRSERGRRVRPDGYIDLWEPDHPLARRDGYVFEHRKVAWQHGILTDPDDHVHHRNGDKQDNRPSNLEALDLVSHAHAHVGDLVANQHGVWRVGEGVTLSYQKRRSARKDWECAVCGKDISHLRLDAKYCGAKCRMAAYEARHADEDDVREVAS